MKVERYIPAFVSGFHEESAEVSLFEELMNIKWIKQWKKFKGFYRFSIAIDNIAMAKEQYAEVIDIRYQHALMAEFLEGREWWVAAIIREKDISMLTDNLPVWEGKRVSNKNKDKDERSKV